MTATVHPLHLAGRWNRGFDGHHVYLARDAADPDLVKLGATGDLERHLADLGIDRPRPMEYAIVLPGDASHKRHIGTLMEPYREQGSWYHAAPALAFMRHLQGLVRSEAADGPAAMRAALATVDPSITDLQRRWRSGTPVDAIASMAGKPRHAVEADIRRLRAMGYDLRYDPEIRAA